MLFKIFFAIPNRQETRTILNLFLILVTCCVCPLPVMMWGPPPSPPPLPPLPPAASTLPTPNCGWRRQKGHNYWERAFQSLRDVHQTHAHPAATAVSPQTDIPASAPTAAGRVLEKHEEVSTDTNIMDISTNTKLSTIYYQTRNTRRAHNTTTMHNIDNNTTHPISNTHIGSFDTEHKINNNFLASRNDSIQHIHQTSHFPLTRKTCSAPLATTPTTSLTWHPTPRSRTCSVTKTFQGTVGGGEGLCIRTVRVEDGLLTEITPCS